MAVRTEEYMGSLSQLMPGERVEIGSVPWSEYEQLLLDIGDGSNLRVSYDRGRMEIVAPLPIHEKYKSLIHDLVIILGEESNLPVEPFGSTTFKRELKSRGVEPDDCFYIQNAPHITGKTTIDLAVDPPPDLVVEIDTTNQSLFKLAIYADLGVPEVWRFDGRNATFYVLSRNEYREADNSSVLPRIDRMTLSRFLMLGQTSTQSAARSSFRKWLSESVTG